MSMYSCINLISGAVSKCEFKTYLHGVETKSDEYFLWNVQPNQNQNSTAFIRELIFKLVTVGEALIVEGNGGLLLCDSFTRRCYAMLENIYTDVTVGDFKFNKSFAEHEVMYLSLPGGGPSRALSTMYHSYGTMIDSAVKQYKRGKGLHAIMKLPGIRIGDPKDAEYADDLVNNRFRKYAEAENAVLPLRDGYTIDSPTEAAASLTTRDIRAMYDDALEYTARALGIPPALVNGKVEGTDAAVSALLTFCIDTLCDMIREEANRKRMSRAEYLSGTRIDIDTSAIKHIDVFDVAASIDKLISDAVYSVNDIRRKLGENEIAEDWANEYVRTKNYENTQTIGKGGENT